MIPDTKSGLPAMACVSAMQKAIRRGLEREAMEFAVELMHTRKAFHIDGLQSPRSHLPRRPRHAGGAMGRAVRRDRRRAIERALQQEHRRSPADGGQLHPHDGRAPKSRAGCHFAAAIGLRSMLEDFVPEIPDYAIDQHTLKAQGDGPWPRPLPQRGREVDPAADRAGPVRGRGLSAVGDRAAQQMRPKGPVSE